MTRIMHKRISIWREDTLTDVWISRSALIEIAGYGMVIDGIQICSGTDKVRYVVDTDIYRKGEEAL